MVPWVATFTQQHIQLASHPNISPMTWGILDTVLNLTTFAHIILQGYLIIFLHCINKPSRCSLNIHFYYITVQWEVLVILTLDVQQQSVNQAPLGMSIQLQLTDL